MTEEFISNEEYFKNKEKTEANKKIEDDKKRKIRRNELKSKITKISFAIFFMTLIGIVIYVGITNYYENRDYYGIEKHMKFMYDVYQSGELVDHVLVSQDCKVTISKNGFDSFCDYGANPENVACEEKAMADGYNIAKGTSDLIIDKSSCKIR